ncbi:MAG: VCBS repeat-containing protein, partial [Planctomycetes bacterium]|nr:VCBS repeat-containing protein [Planctomycetota bacterium]
MFSDMDGDGQGDILVMDEDRAAFAGNAGGGRCDQLSYFLREESLPGFAPGIFFSADIDNSGGRDIVIAHADSTRVSILLAGDEPFVTSAILDPGFVAADMAAADLDGDGDMDLVLSRNYESSLTVLRNDRTALLTSLGPPGPLMLTQDTIDLDNWEPHSSALGDFDGDGDLDVAAIDGEDRVIIVENAGDGTFTPGPVFRLDDAREMISITAADFDEDGDLDLAMVAESSRNLLLLINGGDLEFSEREGRELPERPYVVTTAEHTGPGRPDIV